MPESAGLDGVNLSNCLGEGAWLLLGGSMFTHVVSSAMFSEPYSQETLYICCSTKGFFIISLGVMPLTGDATEIKKTKPT